MGGECIGHVRVIHYCVQLWKSSPVAADLKSHFLNSLFIRTELSLVDWVSHWNKDKALYIKLEHHSDEKHHSKLSFFGFFRIVCEIAFQNESEMKNLTFHV